MRYPSWISNSTKAENCAKNKQKTNEQINLLLEKNNLLKVQSFHICKQTVHKKKIDSYGSMIINDVLSPHYICTYQEKKSYVYAFQF